ncbi:MAG TPA: FAD-dependent oxidoreductase [Anaeromyxobacteraceae bacterium]|nr:FAD-dependent oxidoreductase [Anaeromyxobacteraceae bacterium]
MKRLPDGRIEFESAAEVPPVARSFGSTAWNRTGDWRSREPVFRDLTPPCAAACPAGQDVVDQLRLVAQGRLREAGEVILSANPFPAVTGRVCPHPCQGTCNRGHLDGALDVPGVERALGDALLAERVELVPAAGGGGRVAVVGAGPAGLTAAHYLALSGHAVTLYAREDRPGGLLSTGIPPYRLPRAVLEAEVERALRPGVRFQGGRALGRDLDLESLRREFDAVLLALGRHRARRLGIPREDAPGVVDGLALLTALHRGEPAPPGEQVVVVGGGNTALDCARSLLRLGRRVTVAYRRGREDMPAFGDEVAEALEEGVALEVWLLPVAVRLLDGRASSVQFVRARPGDRDASGRPRPVPIPGSECLLLADLVVAAAGEGLDPTGVPPELLRDGAVLGSGAVLSAGDCSGGGGTVAHAIGEGRRAAAELTARLGGRSPTVDLLSARGARGEVAGFDRMRPAYFLPAPPRSRSRADAAERRHDQREVRAGFDAAEAIAEAARCLACGTCTGCDNCYQFCPDRAVVRGAPGGYAFDPSRCKGCGVCVEECPRGAIGLRELGGPS